MLEMLINPKRAERKTWEMFFVGLIYASLSVLLVNWIFSGDAVLAKYSGIFVVTFSVMFSMPFMYYIVKLEEEKDIKIKETGSLLREHSKALLALMWLFFGFIIAFSVWYIVLPGSANFQAQVETYCMINRPGSMQDCVQEYGFSVGGKAPTAKLTAKDKIISIFANNIYVLIFTLVFSLIFGAGAIFVLAWNASVIAAAIGIFTKLNLKLIPLGVARYMIHGIPEIGAYFIAALAGGIISVAMIRHDFRDEKFWRILQDSLNLIIIAIVILFAAALIEVFITPKLF